MFIPSKIEQLIIDNKLTKKSFVKKYPYLYKDWTIF